MDVKIKHSSNRDSVENGLELYDLYNLLENTVDVNLVVGKTDGFSKGNLIRVPSSIDIVELGVEAIDDLINSLHRFQKKHNELSLKLEDNLISFDNVHELYLNFKNSIEKNQNLNLTIVAP